MDMLNMYGGCLYSIAHDIATSGADDYESQNKIFNRYGLSIDNASDSEIAQIENMIDEMVGN